MSDKYYFFEYKNSNIFIKQIKDFDSLIFFNEKKANPLLCLLPKIPESEYTMSIDNFYELVNRTNKDSTFQSHNLMDYSFSHSDLFTQEQRDRIRNVLYYSPLIPGPKKNSNAVSVTRATNNEIFDLPIHVAR